jgi:hypothetical protein
MHYHQFWYSRVSNCIFNIRQISIYKLYKDVLTSFLQNRRIIKYFYGKHEIYFVKVCKFKCINRHVYREHDIKWLP